MHYYPQLGFYFLTLRFLGITIMENVHFLFVSPCHYNEASSQMSFGFHLVPSFIRLQGSSDLPF
jgi:hypothetical protein